MKRLAISVLRLLIGMGFMLSLVFGAMFIILTFFDGPSDNLVLSPTGPHWEYSIGVLISGVVALFFAAGWRPLPPTKAAGLLPALGRALRPLNAVWDSLPVTIAMALWVLFGSLP